MPAEPWNKQPRVAFTCPICGTTIEVPPFRAKAIKACGRRCANVIKSQVRGEQHWLYKPKVEMACEVCGQVCQVKPSLAERFRFCSRRCTGVWVTRNNPRVSSIEVLVAAYLDVAGVEYQQQGSVGRYTPDFVIGQWLIEVDGIYWHTLPNVKARDERKDVLFRQLGYEVIRIGETAIRAGDFSALDPVLGAAEPFGQQALFP